jgi:hypothetical protein
MEHLVPVVKHMALVVHLDLAMEQVELLEPQGLVVIHMVQQEHLEKLQQAVHLVLQVHLVPLDQQD